jgi:hypothetical protein
VARDADPIGPGAVLGGLVDEGLADIEDDRGDVGEFRPT